MTSSITPNSKAEPSNLVAVLACCRTVLISIAVLSGIINILMLTGSVFMMQVYDRVLGSQSVPTLVALSIIAVAAYAFQGALDAMRGRLLALTAERVDEVIGPKVYVAMTEIPLRTPRDGSEALQPLRDLEAVRTFLAGNGPLAFFDLPWLPFYLAIMFLLHPLLGFVTLGGALFLIFLTFLTEMMSKAPIQAAQRAVSARNLLSDTTQRHAEVVRAMGMLPALNRSWNELHATQMAALRSSTFVIGGLSMAAKTFRMILQSAMLGLGAYLAIKGQLSAGSIIAASILSSRALAPIDLAIGSWKGFIAARQAHGRLRRVLMLAELPVPAFELPRPSSSLSVDRAVLAAPGTRAPIVKRANFALRAGQGLGIIGASASGKSSLARGLVGIWQPLAGRIMLDGASLDHWDHTVLGQWVGYLPQDVQLFDGTIAQNIARFGDTNDETVIAAANAAGLHQYIVGLEKGYETRVGLGGTHLSVGLRQRIGLARALFNDPFLVVLDEPNSNLDAEGEAAVSTAIRKVRERGGIAVVVAHRPSALQSVDMVLAMADGEVAAFGPRDEVLAKITKQARKAAVVPTSGNGSDVQLRAVARQPGEAS